MDELVFYIMMAGGIVFIGGIALVLFLLAFCTHNSSESARDVKTNRQSDIVLNHRHAAGISHIPSAHANANIV